MVTDSTPAWRKTHFVDSTIVDLHAHPSLKASLFNRTLTSRFRASRSFDPFGVRTDFPKLREGGLDVLLSTIYAPEKGILEECRYLECCATFCPPPGNGSSREPTLMSLPT